MSSAKQLGRSVIVAAVILLASAMLAWAAPAYLSDDMARRLFGVLLGAVVVAYSNSIPKMLASRARTRCSPAQDQAARRFAGWSMVLGGLGYMLAWMFAPLSMAALLGGAALAIGLALAVLRCLRLGRKSSLS